VRIKCALLSWEALRQGLESETAHVSGDIE